MNEEQLYLNFDEYRKVSEPHKRERAEAWRVAIGLQAVDGLQVSEYLKQTARQHIEGEITIDEARKQIKQYYISKTQHDADEHDDTLNKVVDRGCHVAAEHDIYAGQKRHNKYADFIRNIKCILRVFVRSVKNFTYV